MKAHLAADYAIGDPAEAMVEISPVPCAVCGGILDPLLGKVLQGTSIAWEVWIDGNYEHRDQPDVPHIPVPEGIDS